MYIPSSHMRLVATTPGGTDQVDSQEIIQNHQKGPLGRQSHIQETNTGLFDGIKKKKKWYVPNTKNVCPTLQKGIPHAPGTPSNFLL